MMVTVVQLGLLVVKCERIEIRFVCQGSPFDECFSVSQFLGLGVALLELSGSITMVIELQGGTQESGSHQGGER